MSEKSKTKYGAAQIKVLEGLGGVRKRFDVIGLSKKSRRKGDILILSKELIEIIKPFILESMLYKIGGSKDD